MGANDTLEQLNAAKETLISIERSIAEALYVIDQADGVYNPTGEVHDILINAGALKTLETKTFDDDLASAVVEAYDAEGVKIFLTNWINATLDRRTKMRAGVVQEWSGERP